MYARADLSTALVVLIAAVAWPAAAEAQCGGPILTDSAAVVPGPDYAAGGFHRFWWGDHYRDTWTTRVRVPVLDVAGFAGGLEPLSAGGGMQTRSLWFRGGDGKVYAFRSIYKYATELVPEVLRGTYVEELFQDQMSSQHPYAPLIASPLMRAAAVIHSEPEVYLLPDSAMLGRFGDLFGGLLGTLAVRPVGPDGAIAVPGAEEVVDGFEVVERLRSDPSRRLDARAYLTARLIDILIGDWDRHADQWLWAWFPDEPAVWRPIPTDRDQAFARLDGLLLALARRRLPMLTSFRDEYDDAARYHYQARFIDRLALTGLERSAWDSTARALQSALTDAAIDDALAAVPDAAETISGPFLRSGLRSRRDALPRIASEMYELLAREPYVHGTDAAEVARVTGTAEGVEIVLGPATRDAAPYFRRVFLSSETREVRLYLHGGDDRAVIDGRGRLPVKVRIIGGPGDDEFHFAATVDNVRLYDEEGSNRATGAADGEIDDKPYAENPLVPESGAPAPARHWGSFGYPFFTGGFNPDVGLAIGGAYSWFDYGFRKDPYASRVDLSAAASTRLKFAVALEAELRFENSPLFSRFAATGTSFETVNFYGIGNDSEAIEDTASDFYDVENTRVRGTAILGSDLGRVGRLGVGLTGGFSNTEDDPATFLGQSAGIYGAGKFGQVGATARVELETVKPDPLVVRAARPVAWLRVSGAIYPEAIDVRETYGSLSAVGAVSVPLGIRRWEVAARAGGKKVWGDPPFFDLAFIGGDGSLRGWPEQRFAGDASLYGSAEFRFDLFHYRLVFPSTFGLLALGDAGRVWVDGESPGDWRTGYGGGIWLALRGTRSIVSIVYAESEEDSGVYFNLGFPF